MPLLVAFSSSCYSDTVTTYGVTPNAADMGLQWSMGTYLPDYSQPNVSVYVNGLIYQYRMNKAAEDSVTATVRNEDAINGGYVFSETDDWSGVPGNSIKKVFRFSNSDAVRWGRGEISVNGPGTVTDPNIVYTYRMDVEEVTFDCVAYALSDPSCPGFYNALRDYLLAQEELNPTDPYYDQWVQLQLEESTKEKNQEDEILSAEQQEEEEVDLEVQMFGENRLDDLIDTEQQATILAALSSVPTIQPYYTINIPGGQYNDVVTLEDASLPDNRRVLNNLAADATHTSMVRSQYDREQQE